MLTHIQSFNMSMRKANQRETHLRTYHKKQSDSKW